MTEKEKPKKSQHFHKGAADYIKFSGMGFQMVAVILLCYFGGRKLDAMFTDGGVIFTVVCLLVGVIGTMISVIAQVMKGDK